MSDSSYIPYRDLCDEINSDHKIGSRKTPSGKDPKYLDKTTWNVDCVFCGAPKTATYFTISTNSIPRCSCRLASTKLSKAQMDQAIGLGAIHMQQTDKSAFLEYLQRREEERLSSYSTKHIPGDHAKSKKPN